jgi:hypothetical protein
VVVGNWLKPPEDLHLGKLFDDEVVCWCPRAPRGPSRMDAGELARGGTYRADGRLTRARAGVIDEYLESLDPGAQHHGALPALRLIPAMVASSLLVLTTGAQYCVRLSTACPSRYRMPHRLP